MEERSKLEMFGIVFRIFKRLHRKPSRAGARGEIYRGRVGITFCAVAMEMRSLVNTDSEFRAGARDQEPRSCGEGAGGASLAGKPASKRRTGIKEMDGKSIPGSPVLERVRRVKILLQLLKIKQPIFNQDSQAVDRHSLPARDRNICGHTCTQTCRWQRRTRIHTGRRDGRPFC
ncbi:hypothetical protein VULLAG_LOCUS22650 [Vulpes lagopus]